MTEEVKQENISKPQENQPKEQTEEKPLIKSEENEANWRKFREERERLRREKAEADALAQRKAQEAEAMKAALEAMMAKPSYTQMSQEYETPDEKELIKKLVMEELEKERVAREEKQRKEEMANLPRKLAENLPDFDKICSPENLDYFEYKFPRLARGFRERPDSFQKWEDLYHEVKEKVFNAERQKEEKAIERNQMKPQASIPALTNNEVQGNPWKLTEERRKANWLRMSQDWKNVK